MIINGLTSVISNIDKTISKISDGLTKLVVPDHKIIPDEVKTREWLKREHAPGI